MPSDLVTLPRELQTTIADYIFMPDDLKSFRVVCKELEPVAIAQLYREVKISLPNYRHHHLYRQGHIALRSIRHLTFEYNAPWNGSEPADSVREDIRRLLLLLPHNLLKSIVVTGLLPLDKETILLLAATQRKLTHIALGPIYDSYLELPKILKPWPAQLRSLEIQGYIGDERDLSSYREMMKNSSAFEFLIFRALGTEPDIEGFMDKMNDTTTVDGLISKTLSIETGDQRSRATSFTLSQLCLHNVELSHAGRTFTQNVDFSRLRTLDLFGCEGASILMQVLTPNFRTNGCSLRGFTIAIDNYPESFDSNVLVSFLDCLKDLEYLTIDLWSLTVPFDLSSINEHAHTMDRLYINIGSNRGGAEPTKPNSVIPLDELRTLCSKFTELTQLALPLPRVNLIRGESEEDHAFQAYLSALSLLPKLNILRSFTWPSIPVECAYQNDDELQGWELKSHNFDRYMQGFAQRVVGDVSTTLACPKLRLLSFGDRSRNLLKIVDGGTCFANSRCYSIERKSGETGPPKVSQISRALIKYYRPDCSAWHKPPSGPDFESKDES